MPLQYRLALVICTGSHRLGIPIIGNTLNGISNLVGQLNLLLVSVGNLLRLNPPLLICLKQTNYRMILVPVDKLLEPFLGSVQRLDLNLSAFTRRHIHTFPNGSLGPDHISHQCIDHRVAGHWLAINGKQYAFASNLVPIKNLTESCIQDITHSSQATFGICQEKPIQGLPGKRIHPFPRDQVVRLAAQ